MLLKGPNGDHNRVSILGLHKSPFLKDLFAVLKKQSSRDKSNFTTSESKVYVGFENQQKARYDVFCL